ncbi:MAG: glycosyltransferase [Parachlamydiales bacterium]|nr:glycosyltransferase [Parachlamydiales bacterium]
MKLSIVIPTKNSASNIFLTLESVLKQRLENIEIIVVDAGSNDNTIALVQNSYVKLLQLHQKDSFSLYALLNKGLEIAQGEWVTFLRPGDCYLNNTILQECLDTLQYSDCNFLYGGAWYQKRQLAPLIYKNVLNSKNLKRGLAPSLLSSFIFKTDFLRQYSFNERFITCADFELFCRLKNQPMLLSNKVIVDVRATQKSLTQELEMAYEKFCIIFESFGLWAALTSLKNPLMKILGLQT